jgi:hypothetical protein
MNVKTTDENTLSIARNVPLRRLSAVQFTALAATYVIYFASMALMVEEMRGQKTQPGRGRQTLRSTLLVDC